MKLGTLTLIIALIAGGSAALPAGARAADEPPPTTSAPEPTPTAPVTTAPPAPTPPPTRAGPAEDFPSFDCAPGISLCLRTVTIRVEGLPDTAAPFEFHFHETRDRGGDRDEFHDATEAVPVATNTSLIRSYAINLSTPAAGYTAIDSVTCTGLNQRIAGDTVIISAGNPLLDNDPPDFGNVTCTYVVRNPGSITIRHSVAPTRTPDPFSYTATGSGVANFALDNDTFSAARNDRPSSRAFTNLVGNRNRTFTLTPRAGFRLTDILCTTTESISVAAGRVTVFLAHGEDVSCTFFIALVASVRITLDVRPDDPLDIEFDTSDIGGSTTTMDDDGVTGPARLSNSLLFRNLLPGSVQVRQLTDTTGNGIDLRSITCNGPLTLRNLATRLVGFALSAGEDMVCTFTSDRRGSITVVTDSLPDSATNYTYASTAAPPTFTLDDDADATFPRSLTIPAVPAGARHVITQGVPPGSPPWRLLSIGCNTGEVTDVPARTATVTVDPGEDVTCTFANAQFQPDALIAAAAAGPFGGEGLRSPTVLGAQTVVKGVASDGQTRSIFVKVRNDSGITDDLILRSAESGQGRFAVSYRRGTQDLTAQILSAGGFVFPNLPPGAERVIVIEFTSQTGSAPGSARNADLTVTSGTAPAATDVVRARAERN